MTPVIVTLLCAGALAAAVGASLVGMHNSIVRQIEDAQEKCADESWRAAKWLCKKLIAAPPECDEEEDAGDSMGPRTK